MLETATRRTRKRDRTRAQIFAAAMELFRAHGFTAVTIEQVCAAADVAKGTFFLHFASKAALLGEWNRALAAELSQRLAEQRGSSLAEYRALVDHLGAQWRERPDAARALLCELLAAPSDLHAVVEAVVRRGQQRGELRRTISPRLAAAAFLASCAAVFCAEDARDAAPSSSATSCSTRCCTECTSPSRASSGRRPDRCVIGWPAPRGSPPMPMPKDVGVVETMIGIPSPNQPATYDFMRPLFRDRESLDQFDFPVQYMFKDVPKTGHARGLHQVHAREDGRVRDREGGDRRLARQRNVGARACASTPTASFHRVRRTRTRRWRACAGSCASTKSSASGSVGAFPCGLVPQVPINDKQFYPIYAKCVELDIAIFCCAGVPGPRIPMDPQHVSTSTRCAGSSQSSSSCSATAASRGRTSP